MEPVAFYYDLGNPECWLVAERIAWTLPVVPEFVPVTARPGTAGGEAHGQGPTGGGAHGQARPDGEHGQAAADPAWIAGLAARARELGLLALRWPSGWPPDTTLAARAATYAAGVGKVVAFSLAAFRQAFAGGRDLADPDTVLIAAAACEMHPNAVLRAVTLRFTERALARSCARALAAGARRLPAITVGARLFDGEDCPERAAAALAPGAGAAAAPGAGAAAAPQRTEPAR